MDGVEISPWQSVVLAGERYAIVPEGYLLELLQRLGDEVPPETEGRDALRSFSLGDEALARRLGERRRLTGLTQAELAARAGIRPETLSRIECARTTPDFGTIRKLVVAMNEAEQEVSDGNAA